MISSLEPKCTYTFPTCICIYLKMLIKIWQSKHGWCIGHGHLQVFKCFPCFSSPFKIVFLKYESKWLSYKLIVLHISPVVTGQTQESPQSRHIIGQWPINHCFNLSLVRFHPFTLNEMPHVLKFFFHKGTFISLYEKLIFFQDPHHNSQMLLMCFHRFGVNQNIIKNTSTNFLKNDLIWYS